MSHEDVRTFRCDVCGTEKAVEGDPYLPDEWFELTLWENKGCPVGSADLCHDCYWTHSRLGWFHEIVKRQRQAA